MSDVVLQRKNMVESQVRPSDVTDRRITATMHELARERFVSHAIRPIAYMDEALPFAGGRAMLAPRVLARLVQLAAIQPTDHVLDIGCLTGYSSALLARLAKTVVALEVDTGMADLARKTLAQMAIGNVEVVAGSLVGGHSASAPYDAMVLEGVVECIPAGLFDQLAQGGRLVAIVADTTGVNRAVLATKSASVVSRRIAFEASGAPLPGFSRPKAFEF